jgi:hypothetical protein
LAVSKAHADAERKLEAAERELSRHRLLIRGRRRDALRSEIALRQAAIRMADKKLVQLEQEYARARSPLRTRDLASDERPLFRERALERRPPTRERSLGLEL